MTEVEFTSRREVEEPLYLDSARSRAPSLRPAERVFDAGSPADRPLQLDFPREPRPRGRGGLSLVVACGLTFLLGAGAGALYLQPSLLRDAVATVLGSATTADAKTATQPAPMPTEPAQATAAIAAPLAEAAPAPEITPAPSPIPDAPPASEPHVEPPAKPKAAASKPHPRRAAAPKKHAADASPARAHPKPKPPLDLDALERSLR